MDIPGITTTSQAAGAATQSGPVKSVGKDDFLRLLTAQLKAQNPLNPMDGTAFTAQLAQFSSLEQLTNINSRLGDMIASQNSLQSAMASDLIGKKVVVEGNTVALNGQADLPYSLSGNAAKVSLSLFDAAGALVRKQELAAQTAGEQRFHWDGKDQGGAQLQPGRYSFTVDAVDSSGHAVGATTLSASAVTGVAFQNNNTYLNLDGNTRVKLGDIHEIQGGI